MWPSATETVLVMVMFISILSVDNVTQERQKGLDYHLYFNQVNFLHVVCPRGGALANCNVAVRLTV